MKPALAATEARVAGLVAEGAHQPDVAAALALRPSSVEKGLRKAR